MDLDDKIRARVAPFLRSGERHLAAFPAMQGLPPPLAIQYRVVAVTDQGIHIFSAALWRVGQPRRLLRSLPPGTVIDARTEFFHERVQIADETMWVTHAFADLLRDAIAASQAIDPDGRQPSR